jgi:hypothetical protein
MQNQLKNLKTLLLADPKVKNHYDSLKDEFDKAKELIRLEKQKD